jgi:hypothetical protein
MLVIVCGVLVVLTVASGPRLRDAVAGSALTTKAGGEVRLILTEPPAALEPSQITVTPAASPEVSVSGSVVVVTFDAPLRASERYSVRIDGVRSRFGSPPSTIEYGFETADEDFLYLTGDANGDAIYSASVNRGAEHEVFAAPDIRSFVRVGSALLVVTGDDDSNQLAVVDLEGGALGEIALPSDGTISAIAADQFGATAAVVFTSTDAAVTADHALFTVSFATGTLDPVEGASGQQHGVDALAYIPGTPRLAVHTTAGTTSVLDPADAGAAIALGSFPIFDGVSSDGEHVIVGDGSRRMAVPVGGGTPLPLPTAAGLDTEAFAGAVRELRGGDRLEAVRMPAAAGSPAAESVVVRVSGDTSLELYRPDDPESRISRFEPSANDQYAALEVSTPDGAGGNSVAIVIIDAETGATVRFAAGSDLQW